MRFVYRKAKPGDVDAIVDLAVESVSRDALPVTVDRDAMRDSAMRNLNPAHFMWVTEFEGKIVAAVAAIVQPIFWGKGLQMSVLLYYSRVKGAGIKLLRNLAEWMKGRHGIKIGIIELEPGARDSLIRFMKKLGFARESVNLTFVRGA